MDKMALPVPSREANHLEHCSRMPFCRHVYTRKQNILKSNKRNFSHTLELFKNGREKMLTFVFQKRLNVALLLEFPPSLQAVP